MSHRQPTRPSRAKRAGSRTPDASAGAGDEADLSGQPASTSELLGGRGTLLSVGYAH